MKNRELYRNGDYYVLPKSELYDEYYPYYKTIKPFIVCDQDGCDEDIQHIGDGYDTLKEATVMVDFWQNGGHWSDRPDKKENS